MQERPTYTQVNPNQQSRKHQFHSDTNHFVQIQKFYIVCRGPKHLSYSHRVHPFQRKKKTKTRRLYSPESPINYISCMRPKRITNMMCIVIAVCLTIWELATPYVKVETVYPTAATYSLAAESAVPCLKRGNLPISCKSRKRKLK